MTEEKNVPVEITGTNTEKKQNTRKRRTNQESRKQTTTRGKRTRSVQNQEIFKKSNIKVIPLGGLHEVGKNITVFEYEDEIIIVDCGISFPEDDMLGIDLVIPDVTY